MKKKPDQNLCKLLVELRQVLLGLYEIDWFYNIGSQVNYSNPKNREMVKNKVNHAIGGLSILYLFAIFENYFDIKKWDDYIEANDLKILKAYRHVRHCVAHGYHGERVSPMTRRNIDEYNAFEEVIQNNLFEPKNIITLDSSTNTITILNSAGIFLKQFMDKIAQSAIPLCADV